MSANSKPFIFILLTFLLIFAVSFLGNSFTLFGVKFKNINIISELIPDSSSFAISDIRTDSLSVPKKDSIYSIPDYHNTAEIIGYENTGIMKAFVKALRELQQGKRKKVRIAYFGDSMIEGDLMSQDLRKMLQDYFGGDGVGFVPVTSVVAGFRQSIIHSFSNNWKEYNFLNRQGMRKTLFLSGHVFRPEGTSSVSYSAVRYPHLDKFEESYLIYGESDSTEYFTVNDSIFGFKKDRIFNSQLVALNQKNVRASFSGSKTNIYGFSFESARGIFLDNLAFRGISGIELQQIPLEMLKEINSTHPYDLIIIQYGPNLLFKPDLVDFRWYEKPMLKAIKTIQSAFPEASILLVGAADKATRYDGEYISQKGVLPLNDIQNHLAVETQTNFWSLYNAMGGRNSMIRWVNSNPPLANLDYTHLTHKGASRVAKIFFEKLMQVYDPEAASRAQIQPIVRYVNVSRGL